MGFKEAFLKNLPTILTVAGIVGVGGTVFFAIKVTPEAKKRIDGLKHDKEREIWDRCEEEAKQKFNIDEGSEPSDAQIAEVLDTVPKKEFRPAVKDVVKEVSVLYLPTVLMGGASIAAFVAANTISVKRLTATSAALTATEEAFRTYRDKVVEQIGEKKAAEVVERIAKEKVEKNPPKSDKNPDGQTIVVAGEGDTLLYDALTGRYFTMNFDEFKRRIVNLNFRLIHEDFISKNEYYSEIGLPPVSDGDDNGWSVDKEISPTYSCIMADVEHGERPCIVVDFLSLPGPRFRYGDGVAYSRY